MGLKHDEGWTVPLDAPFYPPLPAFYRNVKFHFVFFTARPESISRYLPEPLEPSPDGQCVAAGMDVPFCTNYGAFQEAFVVLKCTFRGQSGYFCSHVFHNGPEGIAAGREIYGTPKVFAQLSVKQVGRAMLTEVSMGGCQALKLSSTATEVTTSNQMPSLNPAWRLKIIPRADGPGPALKQLIDCSKTTRDEIVHFLARGKGTVAFGASSLVDLTSLEPASYGDAFHMECSYSEHFAEVAYDYLRQTSC